MVFNRFVYEEPYKDTLSYLKIVSDRFCKHSSISVKKHCQELLSLDALKVDNCANKKIVISKKL